MNKPTTDFKIVDNVFVKMHYFAAEGDTHDGHSHVFDHITLLATGSVLMKHDKGQQEFKAPHLIVTPKGIKHQFTALEPNTIFCCVHAIRDGIGVEDVSKQEITQHDAVQLMSKFPLINLEPGQVLGPIPENVNINS
jgi:quercetin dioxygenase-like cupin family protein